MLTHFKGDLTTNSKKRKNTDMYRVCYISDKNFKRLKIDKTYKVLKIKVSMPSTYFTMTHFMILSWQKRFTPFLNRH